MQNGRKWSLKDIENQFRCSECTLSHCVAVIAVGAGDIGGPSRQRRMCVTGSLWRSTRVASRHSSKN